MEKKKILIVDDEKNIAKVFKLLIENTGKYEARTETIGSKAFASAKEFQPDLVLLDIMMPDMDGGEIAKKMKADEETRDIPVVFISAAITKEEAKRKGTIQGGYPIIAKPVPEEELLGTVEKYIRKKSMPGDVKRPSSKIEKNGLPSKDRRDHKRIQAGSLLSYVCMDEHNSPSDEGAGNALNISQGGLLLETPRPIKSKYVQLTINTLKNELLDVKGKVIYALTTQSNQFHTGINFHDSDERSREFVIELVKIFSLQKNR